MRVGIIGGGITGLSAAYELSKKGCEAEILEACGEMGGIAGAVRLEGNYIEKYYHHFFKSDKYVISLLKELGIEESLKWHESSMGYFADGRVYKFGTPVSLMGFKPLPFADKARFGISVLKLMGKKQWSSLENITAHEWLIKNAGMHVYNKVWKPLLVTKFGNRFDSISMAWFWGKVKLRGASKENGKEVLGYINGSCQVLLDKLQCSLEAKGAKLRLDCRVDSIDKENGKLVIHSGNDKFSYDKVVSTVPLPVFAELAQGILPENYLSRVKSIEYTSVVCMILTLKQPFSNYYWMNIGDEGIPFGGLIEHTNLIDKSEYGSKHILYISNYLYKTSKYYNMNNEELLREYIPYLKKINPGFDESWVEKAFAYRDEYAQPIITCGYSKAKPEFETPVEGLYTASMCNIYPEDRGMNYAIRDGARVAELISP